MLLLLPSRLTSRTTSSSSTSRRGIFPPRINPNFIFNDLLNSAFLVLRRTIVDQGRGQRVEIGLSRASTTADVRLADPA
jgi:hypothetical protein